MQNIIVATIYLLSIFIPLTFTIINSELFEFPKFILLLSGTLVITLAWAIHIYKTRDFKIFPPHLSPISLSVIAVIITQAIATIFSINPYTSFWGYYGRFHGGLLTTICYSLIYFSALKWMDKKTTQKLINITVYTSILVAVYAIAEHFGIDKKLWIQDVQNRPFSTLGQPNWLAAYLLPNIFLILYLSISKPSKMVAFAILFVTLIFTRSRSGFIAFIFSSLTYYLLLARQFSFPKIKPVLFRFTILLIAISLFLGTPYTPSLSSIIRTGAQENKNTVVPVSGTVLESGGTESGDIRKIVWTGALQLIQKYPLLGTGPETFGYTYYWTRPLAHNLTSEWDFLYNKAHNEYLNMAAGAGIIGLLAYLYFHYAIFSTSLTLLPKSKKVTEDQNSGLRAIYPVLGATIVAFTITNFFGFSVIPVYFLTIIVATFPTSITGTSDKNLYTPFSPIYLLIPLVLIYPLRLFMADLDYVKGKATGSVDLLKKAVAIRPQLDLFHAQLGEIYATSGKKDLALKEVEINKKLNPYHLNYFKSRAKIYLTLASVDPSYHVPAATELEQAQKLAPTDPKLAYNLGLVYTRMEKIDEAVAQFQDAIKLKPNYHEPYYALTLLYEQTKQSDKIPALLQGAKANLATYSAQLKEKIEKYD